MKVKFLRTFSTIYSSETFKYFVVIFSLVIYLKFIGIRGFSILAILLSFIYLFGALDFSIVPHLAKFNLPISTTDGNFFQSRFNTTYNLILLSNLIILVFLVPIAAFLSLKLYGNQNLIPMYIKTISIYVVLRTNFYLREFISTCNKSTPTKSITTTGLLFGLIITLILLFKFDLGVISILMGNFSAVFLEYYLLTRYAKKLVEYSPYFSINICTKILKNFKFRNYASRYTKELLFFGSFFISTFFLSDTLLAIITMVILYKKVGNFSLQEINSYYLFGKRLLTR